VTTLPRREHHNSRAGNAAVVLDIGGDVGALVVRMPTSLLGHEVDLRAVGNSRSVRHAEVIGRPAAQGTVPSVVFDGLPAGRYQLALRPAGAVAVTVDVPGGGVAAVDWPE
jgi:hypothetical protein